MSAEVSVILLIVAIPTYFLSKWIISKISVLVGKRKLAYELFLTIVLTPTFYILFISSVVLSSTFYLKTKFHRTKWGNSSKERYKMSNNIVRSNILIGKNKEEVVKLLGGEFYSKDINSISNELGHAPGIFNIDPDFLDILFKDGVVVDVKQIKG